MIKWEYFGHVSIIRKMHGQITIIIFCIISDGPTKILVVMYDVGSYKMLPKNFWESTRRPIGVYDNIMFTYLPTIYFMTLK